MAASASSRTSPPASIADDGAGGRPAPWTPSPELVVTDALAVNILWRPDKRRHLVPFVGREASLAQAAAETGTRKTAMSYWIDQLLDAGLIRLTRVAHVGRHRVPHYRCVADRLRVGLADAPFESYESICTEFSTRWRRLSEQALAHAVARQAPAMELVISRDPVAGLRTLLEPRPGAPVKDDYVFFWARLWLAPADRDELQRDLNALWEKYEARTDRQRHDSAVLMHLQMVPEAG
jgi:hypothetical protein